MKKQNKKIEVLSSITLHVKVGKKVYAIDLRKFKKDNSILIWSRESDTPLYVKNWDLSKGFHRHNKKLKWSGKYASSIKISPLAKNILSEITGYFDQNLAVELKLIY